MNLTPRNSPSFKLSGPTPKARSAGQLPSAGPSEVHRCSTHSTHRQTHPNQDDLTCRRLNLRTQLDIRRPRSPSPRRRIQTSQRLPSLPKRSRKPQRSHRAKRKERSDRNTTRCAAIAQVLCNGAMRPCSNLSVASLVFATLILQCPRPRSRSRQR